MVAKTSSGAIEHVKLILVSNLYQTILKLQKEGFLVVGTAGEATVSYKDIPKNEKLTHYYG